MPQGIHDIELALPIKTIWNFVSVMDNWAPLIPGYICHEILHSRQATLTFLGDIGIMKKKITLLVDITEWKQPSTVKFDLTGIDENFAGEGYFLAAACGNQRTKMTGCLDITAKGVKGPMVNSVLKTLVPKMTAELVETISNQIHETSSIQS